MKSKIAKFQLGKKGLTETFIEQIKNTFKKHNFVRISLLKSFTRNREEVVKTAEQLCRQLGEKFRYKIIGFTIAIRKR